MPSSSIAVNDNQGTPVATTYALAGATALSALWRDTSRTLSLPRTLEMTVKPSPTGSKANDKVVIQFRDVRADSVNQLMTGLIRVELSLPKNPSWTSVASEGLVAHLANLFYVGGTLATQVAKIAAGTII